MSLNFTAEKWGEVFDHLKSIQDSMVRTVADIAEIRACMDRIIAVNPAVPQECQE